MKTIQLTTPITVTVADRPAFPNQPAPETREVTVSSLTLRQAIDDPILKRVSVSFFETRFPVIIWEGDAYDQAGNWTQKQLETAITVAVASDASRVVTQALQFPSQPNEEQRKAISERMKAAFPKGAPRPAWAPQVPAAVPAAAKPAATVAPATQK